VVRLRRIHGEFDQDLEVDWKSFLLRPEPRQVPLEEFKKYTESWRRPADMEEEAVFRVWSTDEGPPSHSIPPHVAAKAAASLGPEAFEKVHERLMRAYFTENRNITDTKVLHELWENLGLAREVLEKADNPEMLKEIFAEHNEAINHGVNGVPAIRMEGVPGVLTGVQDEEVYRRLIRRALSV
jgi:predicted DsbA family dithiol-disulfide isomerase